MYTLRRIKDVLEDQDSFSQLVNVYDAIRAPATLVMLIKKTGPLLVEQLRLHRVFVALLLDKVIKLGH